MVRDKVRQMKVNDAEEIDSKDDMTDA
jgi:hypothetical protein